MRLVFQSAPLTDVRGDPKRKAVKEQAAGFQSAPLTDVRGDCPPCQLPLIARCFNPLPSRM